ncbi:MAG: hypothetical protein P1U64_02570 [Alcanivoracaceae bacterium]|jgi:hypothetical protein|nr:hypothetical protein [Alcanivoracaceae bacterium]
MHRIIFTGQVQDGHDREQVKQRFSQLFRINDPARLEKLFSGEPITLKKDLDGDSARKYQAAIIKAGALVAIEPPLPGDTPGQDTLVNATVQGRSLNMETVVSASVDELDAREQAFDTPAEEVMAEVTRQARDLTINTSGAGAGTAVPAAARGLSWGGFFFNWIWGIFNNTWLALLALLPVANLIVPFWLLFKGRELAWQNKRWQGVDHFNRVQRLWGISGAALFAVVVIGIGAVWQQASERSALRDAADNLNDAEFEQALKGVDDPRERELLRQLRAVQQGVREDTAP